MDHLLKQWGIDCLRNSTGFCGTYDVEVTQQCRVSKVYPGILMMSRFLFFVTKRMSCDCVFTAHKRSLGQGNIFRSVCQEFCPQWGRYPSMHYSWYPSMPCRYPGGGIPACLAGLQAHIQGERSGVWPGGISRPTPGGFPGPNPEG